jgi:hypothetical protein
MRFTHANRHCSDHPLATLRRSDDFVLRPVASNPEQSSDVLRWLERYITLNIFSDSFFLSPVFSNCICVSHCAVFRYKKEREERTPSKKPDRRTKSRKSELENDSAPPAPIKKSKIRKGLVNEMEQQENVRKSPRKTQSAHTVKSWQQSNNGIVVTVKEEHISPHRTSDTDSNDFGSVCANETLKHKKLDAYRQEQPKKRWLREACQDQSLWGEKQELAQPLQWNDKDEVDCSSLESVSYALLTPVDVASNLTEKDANLTRPTVLMLAYKEADSEVSEEYCPGDKHVSWSSGMENSFPPEDNLKWMGAMALMELAKTEGEHGIVNAGTPLNLSQPRYTQL